jgi:tRNA nucleotidyltransferase/poly(A) polymerase
LKTGLSIDPSLIPLDVLGIVRALKPSSSYVVGGVVRDMAGALLEGRQPDADSLEETDWDIATSCRPHQALRLLRKAGFVVLPIGIEHGTVVVHPRTGKGKADPTRRYEVTTFRIDSKCYGRHADVDFAETLEEDLKRRDFTVNALAIEPETGHIFDYQGGLEDLQKGIIRAVGVPSQRFQEDYLRLLRAIRFAAALEANIEEETWEAIREQAGGIKTISAERVRDELLKTLKYEKPSHGFLLMHDCGLMEHILPELENCFGVEQNQYHADDVARHTLLTVDALHPRYPFLRFVALMHDLGKPAAKKYMEDRDDYVFYNHEIISARMAVRIMKRLRFSSKEIHRAELLIRTHMYNIEPGMTKKTLRRWLHRIGRENFNDFLRLRMADRRGNRMQPPTLEPGLYEAVRLVRQILRDQDALSLSDLQINGHDLMRLGVKPGPEIGKILNGLLELVLDNSALNRRDILLQQARRIIERGEGASDSGTPDI